MRKLTIEKMQIYAFKKGGKCLSDTYSECHAPLKWECEKGHIWFSAWVNVKKGSWCHKCASETRKGTIIEMQLLAEQKGGKCLSNQYVKSSVKLKWECSKGHFWEATPNNIKRGSWCQKCYFRKIGDINRKYTIQDAINLAVSKKGYCLSKDYKTNQQKLLWQCEQGHRWFATFNSVKDNGSWCVKCINRDKKGILHAQEVAEKRGGKCLSDKYKNNKTDILWECGNGHQWMAKLNNIQNGTWCPYCSSYMSEEKCRYIFEALTNCQFAKSKNILGKRYELDGYSVDLNVAFEYHGEQHYKTLQKYGMDSNDLTKRQTVDDEKALICKTLGIRLIVIPYTMANSNEKLINYIKNQLKDL